MRKVNTIIAVVVLVVGFAVGTAVWALTSTQDEVTSNAEAIRVANAAATQAEAAARRAELAIAAVQNSRLDNCRAANDRHDNTIKQFNAAIAALPPGPRKQQAVKNRNTTIALLEAIVPHQPCTDLIRP